jgi:uncharacterized protein
MYNSGMLITIFFRLKSSLLLAVFLVNSSIAGINECEKAYKSNNFAVAHVECDTQELQTDGRAKFIMASMYENAQGTVIKPGLTCFLFLEAAELEYCEAYIKTSKCYKNELIAEASPLTKVEDANKWEKKAKKCTNITPGKLSDLQEGIEAFVNDQYDRAINYLKPLAKENNDEAQFYLGFSYYRLDPNSSESIYWLSQSAEQGNTKAKNVLDILGVKPEPEQEPEPEPEPEPDPPVKGNYQKGLNAYNKADYKTALEEWLPFAKNNPIHAQVQYYLGYMYYAGLGANISHKKAFEWFTKAVNLNNLDAQYYVGLMHYEGQHVSQSSINAFFWFEKAATRGYAQAQYRLAKLYYDGNGVRKNLKKAEEWATQSANQGNYFAKTLLTEIEKINPPSTKDGLYQKGLEYLKKNQPITAAYWFEKAATRGYAPAQYELAKLYERGKGVPRSIDIAIVWFKKASKYFDSQYQVGRLYVYKRKYSFALFWYAKATLAGDKKAKEALIELIKKRPGFLLWLIIPLLILVKLRSNSKKNVKKEQEERDKKEREQKKQIEREEEEEAQEERNKQAEIARKKKAKKDKEEKAKKALKDKAEKARKKKAKKDKEEKAKKIKAEVQRKAEETKKALKDKAQKEREEEEDKFKNAAEMKSRNDKLEKAKKKLEDKKKSNGSKEIKNTKKKKLEKTKKIEKQIALKPRFKSPTKKRFQIIDIEIGTKEWTEWRNTGIESLDAEKILNSQARKNLLKQKKANKDDGLSEIFNANIDKFQKAKESYMEKSKIKVFPLCIEDKRFPWLIATIDGFSEDFSKLVKISFSELEYKEAKKGLFPRALMQHQLMITGLEVIDYWCYLKNQESILIKVKRDQEMIDKLYEAELNFSEKLNF